MSSPKNFETFEEYKDTLPKEPTDPNSKKEYIVGCFTPDDWKYIHEVLLEDGTLEDNIPKQTVDCVDDYKHSPIRGRYLLNDTEAEQLRNHEKIDYVSINVTKYPGTYLQDPSTICEFDKEFRYASTVKCVRDIAGYGSNNYIPSNPDSSLQNRASYQLNRHMQQADPFQGNDNQLIQDRIQQYGTGEGVDVIVCDQDAWFGHIEFQNNLGGPQNYTGGNPLPGNGTCDLIDLVLEAPYYLDPDFFGHSDNSSKRESRWDGTTVPTNTAAHQWWENNSTSYRSSKFVSPSNGGTATGNNDFGVLSIPSGYTSDNCNGNNVNYQNGSGHHGTPCASQAYGRQYGWAYNANKFYLNLYGSNNIGYETGFDMIKIFHQIKPLNSTYGNQNPTITSNSFGFRHFPLDSGYYYYQQNGTGSGGVNYTLTGSTGSDRDQNGGWTTGTQPKFMSNMNQGAIRHEMQSNSLLTAGNEMISAGVIFCGSAGNTNQKLVKSDHSDYNNYYSVNDNTALSSSTFSSGGYTYRRTINNQGFPCQIGATGSGTSKVYNTICVGALDDDFRGGSTGNEQKVSYSNKGNLIDCYASADRTLASVDDNWNNPSKFRYELDRFDKFYTISSTQSGESFDAEFNGTSSACPIACGIIATKLQYNRTWSVSNVKSWLQNAVGTMPSTNFYYGTEETSATSNGWSDKNAVHDSAPVIIWDALTGGEPAGNNKLSLFGGDFSLSGNLQIT
tara:strand:- start:1547 stop:3733 length:2187 start_codon:yes stop_codon:yes gene_type:complete